MAPTRRPFRPSGVVAARAFIRTPTAADDRERRAAPSAPAADDHAETPARSAGASPFESSPRPDPVGRWPAGWSGVPGAWRIGHPPPRWRARDARGPFEWREPR